MTQLADVTGTSAPPDGPDPSAAQGTFVRLLRFALANIRRRPERAAFAVAGIGLAIATVVIVRTIATGYQVSGVGAVTDAIGTAPYWVVPDGGVHFDPTTGAIMSRGTPPQLRVPAGWGVAVTVTGRLPGHSDIALTGQDGQQDQAGGATGQALARLGMHVGGTLTVGGTPVVLREIKGSGATVRVPLAVARAAGARSGWATLTPPPSVTAADVKAATGLNVTSDPSRPPAGTGLVYATGDDTGRGGFLDFEQKYAAELGGQVGSSILGMIAMVGLVLGFVIAVTSFVAAVQERRREFGIMSSIGLSDEILYFFLVESVVIFVAAYVLGVLAGGAVVAVLLPSFFSLGAWLGAAGLVAMYLPALAIVAALVPVHRLLQQRPVRLLAEAP